MTEDLEAQIEKERKEIEYAPKVPVSQLMPHTAGQSGRCGWCGQWSDDLVPVHDFTPGGAKVINERYKGVQCCGGRHV